MCVCVLAAEKYIKTHLKTTFVGANVALSQPRGNFFPRWEKWRGNKTITSSSQPPGKELLYQEEGGGDDRA